MQKPEEKVHLCSELVKLFVGPYGDDRPAVVANLEEISEFNLELNAERLVPAGSRVEIHCQFHILKGVVESAATDEVLGHFLRVRLDPESRWSEKLFTPQHLFALWKEVEEPLSGPKRGRAA